MAGGPKTYVNLQQHVAVGTRQRLGFNPLRLATRAKQLPPVKCELSRGGAGPVVNGDLGASCVSRLTSDDIIGSFKDESSRCFWNESCFMPMSFTT